MLGTLCSIKRFNSTNESTILSTVYHYVGHSRDAPTGLRQHDGRRWLGAKLAPGHLQPACWHDYDYTMARVHSKEKSQSFAKLTDCAEKLPDRRILCTEAQSCARPYDWISLKLSILSKSNNPQISMSFHAVSAHIQFTPTLLNYLNQSCNILQDFDCFKL